MGRGNRLKTHNAAPTCYDKLQDILKDIASNGSFNQWLNAKCSLLNGAKPLDLILDGKCAEVMAAAAVIQERGYR